MRFSRIVKTLLAAGFLLLAGVWGTVFLYFLGPVAATGETRPFTVASGAGFRDIARELQAGGFIRSRRAFELYAVLSGRARTLQPGRYEVSPSESGPAIARILSAGPEREATVTIPEGLTAIDIDRLLSAARVTPPGAFLEAVREKNLEGRLFPDTYRFYLHSDPQEVIGKLLANFDRRAAPLLAADPSHEKQNLILASILEREVPGLEDRKIVAGLLLKRVAAGIPLQVDASLCYAKEERYPEVPCEPLTKLDKKIESPYNTYLHSGWPPGAIANPGVLAIEGALHPKDSPYWYYLSDPKSGKTIFAKTIDEQVKNQLTYLTNN